jgi:hypothetical protein
MSTLTFASVVAEGIRARALLDASCETQATMPRAFRHTRHLALLFVQVTSAHTRARDVAVAIHAALSLKTATRNNKFSTFR